MSERKLKIANYTLNITVDRNYLGVLSLSLRFSNTLLLPYIKFTFVSDP